jgi:hypothetical protein
MSRCVRLCRAAARHRPVLRAPRQLHQWRAVGRPTDVPWALLVADPNGGPPVARHASQLYEATLEGLVLFAILWMVHQPAAPALCAIGAVPDAATRPARISGRVRARAGRRHRLPGGRLGHDGAASVAAHAAAWASRCCGSPTGSRRRPAISRRRNENVPGADGTHAYMRERGVRKDDRTGTGTLSVFGPACCASTWRPAFRC